VETPLCGHATLASAAVLYYVVGKYLQYTAHTSAVNNIKPMSSFLFVFQQEIKMNA
jgi:predicted PhzF superfamily epimerase YddE/YHI9